jgi:Reverse transcriptase (RNA-dependent DNA polymerase)
MVRPEVAPPQVIRTVKHEAWQVPGFPIPKALTPIVCDMLWERLQAGVLKPCHGPYRNPWFLVKKKNGKYRLVNAAMEYNKCTIRDANLPPSVDEFSEEFAGCKLTSLIDFFSGYDQVPLNERSRDLTAFHTPLRLLRQTTLPQGATNSVAQFVRIVTKILEDLIPHDCMPFLDDVGVKGPTTTYNNTEVLPGVRRFVMEHIQALDRTLERIERAGCTIGPKSQFCMDGVVIVGFVCGAKGRTPETAKVIKILEWKPCTNILEARAFIRVCVYYRIWIPDFAKLAKPIYYLFKKEVAWE